METLNKILLQTRNLVFNVEPTSTLSLRKKLPKKLMFAAKDELLKLGYVLSLELEEKFYFLTEQQLTQKLKFLCDALSESLGANAKHIPLYRKFPEGVPENTDELWMKRLVLYVSQDFLSESTPDKIHILSCGHIIHEDHWDRENYAGCPICEERVDLNSLFFKEPAARKKLTEQTTLKILNLGKDFNIEVENFFNSLCARKSALSPKDNEILNIILDEYYIYPKIIDFSNIKIPVKENVANIFGNLINKNTNYNIGSATHHLKTATDMLRLVAALNGGDVSLTENTKYKSMHRTTRKEILGVLNNLNLDNLTEDMLRHKSSWKRLGECLHPFEYAKQYPKTATAFSVLRETKTDSKLSSLIKNVEKSNSFTKKKNKLTYKNWISKFNEAIETKSYKTLVYLLSKRAGEFSRRLDYVLRSVPKEEVSHIYDVFCLCLTEMSTPILCTLVGYLKYRGSDNKINRVFFPKGNLAKVQIQEEKREKIDATNFIVSIEKELLKRTEVLSKYSFSVIDKNLNGVLVPFSERNASVGLVDISRGSKIKLEENKIIRTFIHWVEPDDNRTDLDSSYLFYDESWKYLGKCAYNDRTFGDNAAIHSGDLTSAPAPHGSTEYVDLDVDKLKKLKVKYVIAEIYSFNNIPFEKLPEGFAGYMIRSDANVGEIFEPKTVKQKFALHGDSTVTMPFIIDIEKMEMLWADIHLTERVGTTQAVESHKKTLDTMCKSLVDYFSCGVRPSIYQLSLIHACSRTNTVFINKEGKYYLYEKGNKNSYELYKNILDEKYDSVISELPKEACLAYLYNDIELTDNSEMYSLYKDKTNNVKIVNAGDLLSI